MGERTEEVSVAVRAMTPFKTQLDEFNNELEAAVVERALEVVRQLPVGVGQPYPIPLSDGGLVLEWDKGSIFADIELRPDRTIVVSVISGKRSISEKYDEVAELDVFLDWIVKNFK